MVLRLLLGVLLSLTISRGSMLGENEEHQVVCAGSDFVLPVYSASRIVTFTPNSPPGPRRVILEYNNVRDPRFEWTRDRMLSLRRVSHSDQGLYSIKLSSVFTYETVRLTVSECIKSLRQAYGESFHHSLPRDGCVLEFSPQGAPPDAPPLVLWNRTDPQGDSGAGRGRVQQDGRVWLAERVTQADQGNYTVRDDAGKVLSRSTLTVQAHIFNVTRSPKESLHIPLFLHLSHAHLIFIPAVPPSDDPPTSSFDLGPPRGPMLLVRDGLVVEQDPRYRSLVSLVRNGTLDEAVVSRLTARHQGTYEVRDQHGNLVSSTSLHVADKRTRWRALLRSITVPSGMFVTLAGFILFLKRFPSCSLGQVMRAQQRAPAAPPIINTQDYGVPSLQHSGGYGHPQLHKPASTWSPHPPGYTPAVQMSPGPSVGGQGVDRGGGEATTSHPRPTKPPDSGERKTSFTVPGASDCLHSTEDCVRFQIQTEGERERWSQGNQAEGERERWSRGKHFFSTLPLDTDTSDSCSVYTSDKLRFS